MKIKEELNSESRSCCGGKTESASMVEKDTLCPVCIEEGKLKLRSCKTAYEP